MRSPSSVDSTNLWSSSTAHKEHRMKEVYGRYE
ncbi:unnamed protein product [Coregonus sp. 'balchen']|nr:unnamed protein product [Coregonus sp. 'balchen']